MYLEIVTIIISIIAIILSIIGVYISRKHKNMDFIFQLYSRIDDLLSKIEPNLKGSKKESIRDSIINSMEYFSFLVNKKYITDKKIMEFFRPNLEEVYEKFIENQKFKKQTENANKEIIQLYKDVQLGKYKQSWFKKYFFEVFRVIILILIIIIAIYVIVENGITLVSSLSILIGLYFGIYTIERIITK